MRSLKFVLFRLWEFNSEGQSGMWRQFQTWSHRWRRKWILRRDLYTQTGHHVRRTCVAFTLARCPFCRISLNVFRCSLHELNQVVRFHQTGNNGKRKYLSESEQKLKKRLGEYTRNHRCFIIGWIKVKHLVLRVKTDSKIYNREPNRTEEHFKLFRMKSCFAEIIITWTHTRRGFSNDQIQIS